MVFIRDWNFNSQYSFLLKQQSECSNLRLYSMAWFERDQTAKAKSTMAWEIVQRLIFHMTDFVLFHCTFALICFICSNIATGHKGSQHLPYYTVLQTVLQSLYTYVDTVVYCSPSSSVVALISELEGPVPALLKAWTTTPYWANFFRLSSV